MILKTMSYSGMHMCVAILVAYALSGSWVIATSIGIIEPIVQTGFYHIHEHLWKRSTEKAAPKTDNLTLHA